MRTIILDGQEYMLIPINQSVISTTPDKRKKLSDEEVLTIRELYQSGRHTQAKLAELFGVTILTVFQIVNNLARKNVK